jgi:predicted Fe-Mo cluster-binding NifX family protein
MRIAVSASEGSLDAAMDPRFGRCPYYVIVDSETMEFEAIENTAAQQGSGAGIQAAQLVGESGADAVVAGNFGPNAFGALSAAGIGLYQVSGGTVKEAVEAVVSGQAQQVGDPTVASKSGADGGSGAGAGAGAAGGGVGAGPGSGAGAGQGRGIGGGGRGMGGGMGAGGGRGMGGGIGAGRGMGMGGGMGTGMGRGMGAGMGPGMGAGYGMGWRAPWGMMPPCPSMGWGPMAPMMPEEIIEYQLQALTMQRDTLLQQVEYLQQQVEWLNQQIEELQEDM